ncbi:hypothetical protein DPEC_G00138130 [Dallia pectoralis]|uniref:Uncharacterized protein n=1 Tax=Dallia pectoralis TaxID=75939 RepID=A0ACC2GLT6_DALPE|nr:hypothetical protein DPEC_G00138130 [Dallia pectoralis]
MSVKLYGPDLPNVHSTTPTADGAQYAAAACAVDPGRTDPLWTQSGLLSSQPASISKTLKTAVSSPSLFCYSDTGCGFACAVVMEYAWVHSVEVNSVEVGWTGWIPYKMHPDILSGLFGLVRL